MFTKRIILALCAFTVLIPLGGCRHHRCCSSSSSSCAPACSTLPPNVLPPAGY